MKRSFTFLAGLIALITSIFLWMPGKAAVKPVYVIAYIPLNWSGSSQEFERQAKRHHEVFMRESNLGQYAEVELKILVEGLKGADLNSGMLVEEVVAFGLTHQPADRYIGLTDGNLAPNGSSGVVGWTRGPDSLGSVVEARFSEVSTHELGHTYALCDEYYYPYWKNQNAIWGCPNPFPAQCRLDDKGFCEGSPASNGNNSMMGPAGMSGAYSFNDPSYSHLQEYFGKLFNRGKVPTNPTPTPPVSTPPSPTPVPQPPLGPIIYSTGGLFRSDSSGKTIQLAQGIVLHPAWSPDGQWVVYSASQGDNLDLWLVSAQGGTPRRLLQTPEREFAPTWMPDSRHIIFVSEQNGTTRLVLLAMDTQQVETLTMLPEPASWPAASADGKWLAFSAAPDGQFDLYRVQIDQTGKPLSSTLQKLTGWVGDEITPAWSADGSQLAFASDLGGGLDLYLFDLTRNAFNRLTDDAGSEWAPRWTGDGRIVYQAFDGEKLGIWVLAMGNLPERLLPGLPYASWPYPKP